LHPKPSSKKSDFQQYLLEGSASTPAWPKITVNLEVLIFGHIMGSKKQLNMNMSDWSNTKLRGGFIPLPNNKIWSLLKLAPKDVQQVFEGVNISTWIYRFPYLSKIDLEQLSNR